MKGKQQKTKDELEREITNLETIKSLMCTAQETNIC